MRHSNYPVLCLLALAGVASLPAQDPERRRTDDDLRKMMHDIADRLAQVAARQEEQGQRLAALQERLAQLTADTGDRDHHPKEGPAAPDRLAQENKELRAALGQARDRLAHHEARSKDLEASTTRVKQEFQDALRAREKEMHALKQAQEDRARAEEKAAREMERRRVEAEREVEQQRAKVAHAAAEAERHRAEAEQAMARKQAEVERDAARRAAEVEAVARRTVTTKLAEERAANEEMQRKSGYEADIEKLKKRIEELTNALEQLQKKQKNRD